MPLSEEDVHGLLNASNVETLNSSITQILETLYSVPKESLTKAYNPLSSIQDWAKTTKGISVEAIEKLEKKFLQNEFAKTTFNGNEFLRLVCPLSFGASCRVLRAYVSSPDFSLDVMYVFIEEFQEVMNDTNMLHACRQDYSK